MAARGRSRINSLGEYKTEGSIYEDNKRKRGGRFSQISTCQREMFTKGRRGMSWEWDETGVDAMLATSAARGRKKINLCENHHGRSPFR